MQNSRELIHRLKETNIQGNVKLRSYDITNMYSNIPQKELIQVIDNALQNNNVPTEQGLEVILLINLKSKLHTYNNHQYKQDEGLPMGAPHQHVLQKYLCNT
jgi:signal transduction histidine kinase